MKICSARKSLEIRAEVVIFRGVCFQGWPLAGVCELDFWNVPYNDKTVQPIWGMTPAFLLGDRNFDICGWLLCYWDQLPVKALDFEYKGENTAHTLLHSAATERSLFCVTSSGERKGRTLEAYACFPPDSA